MWIFPNEILQTFFIYFIKSKIHFLNAFQSIFMLLQNQF